MNAKQQQAEYKRRRTVAIKKLREAGLTEEEIQTELAKVREELGLNQSRGDEVDDSADQGLSEDRAMEEPPSLLPAIISRDDDEPTQQNGRDWSKYGAPERRCIRIKRSGEQCKNAAIKGSTVCMYHGGAAKHVRESARARLENASDRLAKELLGMAIDPNMTPQVKLAAIRDALDRGGLKPPTTVEIGPTKPHEEISADILVGGSREAYRNGTDSIDGLDDSPGIQGGENGYGATDYAHESFDRGTEPASWANADHNPHPATWADGDYGPVSGPPASDQRSARASGRPPRSKRPQGPSAVTGEEAIRQANMANGLIDPDTYGLPPGRSSYYF